MAAAAPTARARPIGVIAAFIRRSARSPKCSRSPPQYFHSRGEYRRGIEQASAHGHCTGEVANGYAWAIGLRLCADTAEPKKPGLFYILIEINAKV
jgi:hypothetical protein